MGCHFGSRKAKTVPVKLYIANGTGCGVTFRLCARNAREERDGGAVATTVPWGGDARMRH